uniref:Ribonuclease A-domain domain-containing protein n=1 Tax=Xiphophorus maculatus TaxID=8083 RepID=A0A3B5PSE5_XIPMA
MPKILPVISTYTEEPETKKPASVVAVKEVSTSHFKGLLDWDCTRNMKRINYNLKLCKETNTFYFDPERELRSICSSGQLVGVATSVFKMIICEHDKISRFPNCLYNGKSYEKMHVAVACENGLPVCESFASVKQ